MRIIVRAARESDLLKLQDIEVDAGKVFAEIGMASIAAADPPSIELLRTHIERGTLWVAVDSADRPVAYASASVVDGEGHLDQVSVRRSYARRGIGGALVEHVCEWARTQGLHAVTLTTFRDVEWNGPLYERYGFVPLAEVEQGPELTAIRVAERAAGIDVAPRIAMRHTLTV
jgi:GNAT superfamily N-acetyltransferase